MNKKGARIAGAALVVISVVFLVLALTGRPAGGEGDGDLEVSLQTREYVMSGVYKVYALRGEPAGLWVAKTIFCNKTGSPVTNLRVRYKLEGFSDWGAWHTHKRLVPTQTVVDSYYPLLSDRCARQTSRTPTELAMEYEYEDARGEKHTGEMTERLTMLGVREVVYRTLPLEEIHGQFQEFFANSPLTAAWVTPDDKAVSGLAALANEKALGAGASISDKNCLRVMREIYEIMRTIRITYQSPGGGGSNFGDKSFDPMLVQSVQYPRDTIRKRSGTCIDLAILYASMLKSQGIKPYLVMLPGHCFPIGELPTSGSFVPVEATCVGGGGRNSLDFDQAVKIAQKEWAGLLKSGQFMLVDIDKCIELGIVPPELEPLPEDILQRWKITEMVGANSSSGRAPGTRTRRTRTAQATIRSGLWKVTLADSGRQVQCVAKVQVAGSRVTLLFSIQYTMTDQKGVRHRCEELNRFDGTIQGNVITAQCQTAVWKMDGRQVTPKLPINLQLRVSADGRSARGLAGGPSGQVQVTMQWTK